MGEKEEEKAMIKLVDQVGVREEEDPFLALSFSFPWRPLALRCRGGLTCSRAKKLEGLPLPPFRRNPIFGGLAEVAQLFESPEIRRNFV